LAAEAALDDDPSSLLIVFDMISSDSQKGILVFNITEALSGFSIPLELKFIFNPEIEPVLRSHLAFL